MKTWEKTIEQLQGCGFGERPGETIAGLLKQLIATHDKCFWQIAAILDQVKKEHRGFTFRPYPSFREFVEQGLGKSWIGVTIYANALAAASKLKLSLKDIEGLSPSVVMSAATCKPEYLVEARRVLIENKGRSERNIHEKLEGMREFGRRNIPVGEYLTFRARVKRDPAIPRRYYEFWSEEKIFETDKMIEKLNRHYGGKLLPGDVIHRALKGLTVQVEIDQQLVNSENPEFLCTANGETL